MKGINATIAAKIVGCSKETSRKYYSDPSFRRDALEKVEQAFEGVDNNFIEEKKSIHERLAEQAENAFEELVSLLADKSTSTGYRIRIAQDFLDRNPETQAGFVARHTQVNPDQLIMAARTAKEMDNVIPIRKEA
jgi:transposase